MIFTDRQFAKEYALHTNESFFLTGRAGTGKTTLLKEILTEINKKSVVVAPTGVAAINAGGMTIHSFFQLPPTGFIPTDDPCDPHFFTNKRSLAKSQKLNRERIQLLIELEFLIIDEISMVRADLLDAIDTTLKRIRKNKASFGGIQVMVIGDLFQLSPVVRKESFRVLATYYKSPYFFDSNVWQNAESITIELKNIYRQEDQDFIEILNKIRIGIRDDKDIAKLNTNLTPTIKNKNIITLTTHNAKAQALNAAALRALDSPEFELEAAISGRFSPSSYPVKEKIVLKEGSQVMFIRNHPDGLYYNGKIGIVSEKKEDVLFISCPDEQSRIVVQPTEWKNIAYNVDKETKEIFKEEIGSFTQYPLKLAWAVTVHKSQGLTFEEVILDVTDTFAPGQLYVALSRAKSLQGLYLISPLSVENIIIDERISTYYKNAVTELDPKHLAASKAKYEDVKIRKYWTFLPLKAHMEYWRQIVEDQSFPEEQSVLDLIQKSEVIVSKLDDVGHRFIEQLSLLTKQYQSSDAALHDIIERCKKAIIYFGNELYNHLINPIEEHYKKWRLKSKFRKYIHFLEVLLDDIWYKINVLFKMQYRSIAIHPNPIPYQRVRYFNPDKPKRVKGATYEITLSLFKKGKSIEEIATIRSLAVGTIESHINRLLKEEKIILDQVMPVDRQKALMKYFPENTEHSITEIKLQIPIEVSFGELRWIQTHLALLNQKK